MVALTSHDHKGPWAATLRRFPDRTGVWVFYHGEWVRPVNVWFYRGAWRVLCRVCCGPLESGSLLDGGGWYTRDAAMTAAHRHCTDCPKGGTP